MNKYSLDYQKTADNLIKKDFPKLGKVKIKVFELKFTKFYGLYIPLFNLIGINKFCRNFSKEEVQGILVHELCHAELFRGMGFWKGVVFYLKYSFFHSVKKKEEDRADKRTIEKGYARDLILSSIRLEKDYPKTKDKNYMSSKRVKEYAQKIGKW